MQALALLLLAAGAAAAGLAGGRMLLRRRLRVLHALALARGAPADAGSAAPARERRGAGSALRGALERTGGLMSLGPLRRWAEGRLRGTGLPLRPEELLAICALGLLAGAGLAAVLPLPGLVRALPVLLLPASPVLYARFARQSRSARISVQLGEALLTLGNGLRAGHSLLQALNSAAQETPAPLGAEFARLLREVSAGIPMDEALARLVERAASPDLDLLVTAVLVQREVGGNLAEILDKISGTIRARVAVQGQLRVVTAQSRMSGWVVGLLPVAVFLLISLIVPQTESVLVSDPIGRIIGIGAIVLEAAGLHP